MIVVSNKMIKETFKELKKIAKEIIEKGDSINYKDLLHRTKLIYEKLIIHNYIVSQKGKKDLDNFNLISNCSITATVFKNYIDICPIVICAQLFG